MAKYPSDNPYPRFKPPTSVPGLLTAMQSAGTYAELAIIAGSWEPNDIERRIYGREWNKAGNGKLRGTFYGPRDGGKIHDSQVDKISSLFPDSNLSWWQRHPIAQILCDASLGQDGILHALNTLPRGEARSYVWDVHTSWRTYVSERPDTPDVIQRLANLRTPHSLLALVGRMRLAQLRGAGRSIDRQYEEALMFTLPDCIARSPHLYLGQEALLEAVWQFLRWSPHAEVRYFTIFRIEPQPDFDFWERFDASVRGANWPGIPQVPVKQMQSRERDVAKIARSLGMNPYDHLWSRKSAMEFIEVSNART